MAKDNYSTIVAELQRLGFRVVHHHQGVHSPFDFSTVSNQFSGETNTSPLASFHVLVHPQNILLMLNSYPFAEPDGSVRKTLNSLSFNYQVNLGFKSGFVRHAGQTGTSNWILSPIGENHLVVKGDVTQGDPLATVTRMLKDLERRRLHPLPFKAWLGHPLYLNYAQFFTPTQADYDYLRPLAKNPNKPDKDQFALRRETIIAPARSQFLSHLEHQWPGLASPFNADLPAMYAALHGELVSLDAKEAMLDYFREVKPRKLTKDNRQTLLTMVGKIKEANKLMPALDSYRTEVDNKFLSAAEKTEAIHRNQAANHCDQELLKFAPTLLAKFPLTPVCAGFGMANLLTFYAPRLLVPWFQTQPPEAIKDFLLTPNPAGRYFSTQLIRDLFAGRFGVANRSTSQQSPRSYLAMASDFFSFAHTILTPEEFTSTLASTPSSWLGEIFYGLTKHCEHMPSESAKIPREFLQLIQGTLIDQKLIPTTQALWVSKERPTPSAKPNWDVHEFSASDILTILSRRYATRAHLGNYDNESDFVEIFHKMGTSLAKYQLDQALITAPSSSVGSSAKPNSIRL